MVKFHFNTLAGKVTGFTLTVIGRMPGRQVLGMGTHGEHARFQYDFLGDSTRRKVEELFSIGIENGDSQVFLHGTGSHYRFVSTRDFKFQNTLTALFQTLRLLTSNKSKNA